MANWESKTVSEVISKISDNYYVLPVIQRRLVWDEDKMELLFDTLLKGNSFGGIMVLSIIPIILDYLWQRAFNAHVKTTMTRLQIMGKIQAKTTENVM